MNRKLWTLIAIVFLVMMGLTIVIPILPALLLDLKNGIMPIANLDSLSPDEVQEIEHQRNILLGWLIAVYPLAQFIGAPILGSMSDVHGRKKILTLSLIGTLIGFVLFIVGILEHNVVFLFLGRIIDGFTGGNVSIVFSAISDISKPEEKSKNFGLVSMAFGLGFIIGPFLGGVLSDPSVHEGFSYVTPFYLTTILTILNIIAIYFFFQETYKGTPEVIKKLTLWQGVENLVLAFKYRDLRLLFTVFFFYAFGFNFFTQFFQVYLIHKFDFTQVQIGNTFGWIGLFIVLTQAILNRYLSTRFPSSSLVAFFLLTLSITIFLLWFPQKSYWIYILLPFMAISQAMVSPNLLSILSGKAGDDRQGEILGVNQSVQSIATAIPPLASGYLINLSMGLPILLGSSLVLLAFLIFVFRYLKL